MRSKKYILSLLAVYLIYMTHGIQAIVISQNLDQFAAQWGTDSAGVYAVIAYTGLAKFISVWVCGELSDKVGRKLIVLIGGVMYIAFFGLLLTTTS
ncbi:MAG: MFS transporter, partial [Oscillospiraceae bacterium]|nr:MFS transporter [Oscillospiraceae bacterium]